MSYYRKYCDDREWKYLMDASKEFFRDLKYRTIHIHVDFNRLNDRVLPPVVTKLMDPLQQLHLYLDTEGSLDTESDADDMEVLISWHHPVKWRSTNLVTLKDIKWFLSIPAQSLKWTASGPLLSHYPILKKGLRKFQVLSLGLLDFPEFIDANYSNYLMLQDSLEFSLPILPSLIELEFIGDTGEINLRNLIYSLSLKRVSFDYTEDTIIIPTTQLKERGVFLDFPDTNLNLIEVDVEMKNIKFNEDEEHDIYDADEVTVYDDDDDEDDEL